MESKAALRRRVRAARAGLVGSQREHAEHAAAEHLLGLPEVADATTIMLYAAHGGELGTDRIVAELHARGAQLLLPRVRGDVIEAVRFTGGDRLAPGFGGVREPHGPAVETTADVVVMPGVAFDRAGGRLGQGGGHYDRLLATLPPAAVRIGLCFAIQVVERVPREPHDLPVDILVTEDGPVRTGAR